MRRHRSRRKVVFCGACSCVVGAAGRMRGGARFGMFVFLLLLTSTGLMYYYFMKCQALEAQLALLRSGRAGSVVAAESASSPRTVTQYVSAMRDRVLGIPDGAKDRKAEASAAVERTVADAETRSTASDESAAATESSEVVEPKPASVSASDDEVAESGERYRAVTKLLPLDQNDGLKISLKATAAPRLRDLVEQDTPAADDAANAPSTRSRVRTLRTTQDGEESIGSDELRGASGNEMRSRQTSAEVRTRNPRRTLER